MDVPRVPPIPPVDLGQPPTGERPSGGGGELPFGPGQKLFAQVVQVLGDGRVVLDIGGERLLASTPLPVRAGDVLAVTVRSVGPVVELDIEAPPVAFSERAYALAAIRQAQQQAGPSAPLTAADVEVLARALERANRGGGTPGDAARERLLALIRPLPLSGDAAPIAEALRERVTAGGALFEAHAARHLAGGAHAAVPPELKGDLRWLLAAVARGAEGHPEIEPLRQRLLHDVAVRQLDVALAGVRDGEVRIDVPVAFAHADATARLTVKDDGPPRREGERPRGRAITLAVAHPDLGPVQAAAQWLPGGSPDDLQIRFAVRDDEAAAVLAPATADLSSRLRAAGFRHVAIAVVVDPETAAAADAGGRPEEPPPGGSIVSALA